MNLDIRIIFERIKEAEKKYNAAKSFNQVANKKEREAEKHYYASEEAFLANEAFSSYLKARDERAIVAEALGKAEYAFNVLVRKHIKPAGHDGSGCK